MFHTLIVYDHTAEVKQFWLAKCATVVANTEPFALKNIANVAVDIL